jgi:hypothetical protein
MENFTLNITDSVTRSVSLPQYFSISDGIFYKLLDAQNYLCVTYYGDDTLSFGLYLYPRIEMHSNDLLKSLRIDQINELPADDFYTAYFNAKNLIEKLAEI